jgi:signal transduction histidine kinase
MDASLLKHIILNLLSNAIKFSPEGSVTNVKSEVNGELLLLTVTDQGIGIPQEDHEHLFERFFRGSNAGNIQGTGLGLHIVAKYAELMNGTISCKKKEPGTEMSLVFNLKEYVENNNEIVKLPIWQ